MLGRYRYIIGIAIVLVVALVVPILLARSIGGQAHQ